MPLFDDYLVVDWSANASPKTGADSIWFALVRRDRLGRPRLTRVANPATREAAIHAVAPLLTSDRRVLLGFDFPNGYPVGFVQAAGLTRTRLKPWLALWQGLSTLIEDDDRNANNRFAIADRLNRRIDASEGPFWGCPNGRSYRNLKPTKPTRYDILPERRLCERWVPRAQPVWKLYTTGSVGSQSLMGIPRQDTLRRQFARQLQVWPFETGLSTPDTRAKPIVLAEVYPSLFPLDQTAGTIKDAQQVAGTARALARRDQDGMLAADFAGPAQLSASERRMIEREEGWILGAGTLRL